MLEQMAHWNLGRFWSAPTPQNTLAAEGWGRRWREDRDCNALVQTSAGGRCQPRLWLRAVLNNTEINVTSINCSLLPNSTPTASSGRLKVNGCQFLCLDFYGREAALKALLRTAAPHPRHWKSLLESYPEMPTHTHVWGFYWQGLPKNYTFPYFLVILLGVFSLDLASIAPWHAVLNAI